MLPIARVCWLNSGYCINHKVGWKAEYEMYRSTDLGRRDHEGKIMARLAVDGVLCGVCWLIR